MTEPFDVNLGGWRKFDRYEIRDDYIRPTSGSESVWYDPWEIYRLNKQEPPYQSLLTLLDELTFQPKEVSYQYALTPESESLVLNWCANYGLLGILSHRAQMVMLSPIWDYWRLDKKGTVENISDRPLFQTQHSYLRTNVGWQEIVSKHAGPKVYQLENEPSQLGQVVPEEYRSEKILRPGVILQPLGRFKLEQEDLSKTWGNFFPDVPEDQRETYQYPMPDTKGFWQQYAEPVDDFISGAVTLRNAFNYLQHIKPLENSTEEDRQKVGQGMSILHALVSSTYLALLPTEEGLFKQHWITISLLSSFAVMLLQDLTVGRKLLRCETCNSLYVADAYNSRYCSDKCRRTAQKRRYRQRLKEKK